MSENSSVVTNPQPRIFAARDDRIPVASPNVYPSRCVGEIFVALSNGGGLQGSGSLISDYTVLTAGHVVKGADNQFLDIKSMTFTPAQHHAEQPYGRYDWGYIRAVFNGDTRDWALISLAEPAGFRTGFLGTSVKLPISRFQSEGDHFSHIGFPGDHTDEMWIDEDGVCIGIRGGRQLNTDIDAAHGQSGGPLVENWFTANPHVVGCLSGGPNPVEDPNWFTPGWESDQNDTWFQWLCNEFGHRHADDRFGGCGAARFVEESSVSEAMLPNYTADTFYADDAGPVVRRFSVQKMAPRLTPAKVSRQLRSSRETRR